MQYRSSARRAVSILAGVAALFVVAFAGSAAGETYYVSSSGGDDANDGLSEAAPFRTVAKVNGLGLQPGDRVLFRCGDVWRAEMLAITRSGTSGAPITFGSYPDAACADKPALSGSLPIAGWSLHSDNIYVADLSAGANAGRFPFGVNGLFQNDERLPFGRWPNLDEDDGGVDFDNGYALVDAQPSGDRISDAQPPDIDWTGGALHIKGMRWYILNRDITADNGDTLTLHSDIQCYDGGCAGWGYFINRHLHTLDREGEWHYDAAANRVYLYSASGPPVDIEGAVVLTDDDRSWGGITLGQDRKDPVSHVVVDNLMIKNWYRDGIAAPTNFDNTELHHITLRNNHIQNVDAKGLHLAVWVFSADDGRDNGWRGGYDITVENNVIDGANHMGVDVYSRNSTFENNVIRNIALIENVGESGIGCGDAGGGQCTESGDGFRIKIGNPADTGHHNTLRYNRIERTGYNGVDIFGSANTLESNTIVEACVAKGDCGGVRTFGRDNLDSTPVYDLVLRDNIVIDAIGNTDGCKPRYKALFGFGLYIDHYSRNIETVGNTIIGSTCHGVLYQNSTGTLSGNTIYNNAASTPGAQVKIGGAPAEVTAFQNNVLYALADDAKTLSADPAVLTGSDNNDFFHPFVDAHIAADGDKTLSEWQAYSGMDANSRTNGFTLAPGEEPLSEIFFNDKASPLPVDLGNAAYLDLDGNDVSGTLTLQPFTSQILIDNGVAAPVIRLQDAILALRICAGLPAELTDPAAADVDGDGAIGLPEAVFALQSVAGLRP